MNRTEWQLLGPSFKKLRTSDLSVWQDLKDEAADYGYQSDYPSLDYYRQLAPKYIEALQSQIKDKLIAAWKGTPRIIKLATDQEILSQYSLILVDEIKTRAFAAMRYS